MKKVIGIVGIVGLMLGLTACSVDQITGTLDLAVDALATVAAVAAPQDVAFINLGAACLNAATVELDSSDSNLQKGTVILGACAKVEAGTAGLSPLGVALSNAIATFLNQVKQLEGIRFSNPKFALAFANSKKVHVNKKKLEQIKKKLVKIKLPK